MPDDKPMDLGPHRQAVKINPWARCSAGALGLAGLASGGIAVFVTHLEAGPVALLAAGVVFTFIALGGVMPTRLKVGDNEAEWLSEVRQAAVAVAVSATVDDRDDLNENLARLGRLVPEVPTMNSLMYFSIAYGLIRRMLDGRGDVTYYQYVSRSRTYIILEVKDGVKALVAPVVRAGQGAESILVMVRAELNMSRADLHIDRALFILDEAPSAEFSRSVADSPNLMAVVVTGEDDRWKLLNALEKILSLTF